MPILTRTCLLVALLLAACNSADHGQPSLVGCLVDEEHVVTDTASIPAGFTLSPADARTLALGRWTGELERDDGDAVTLTLELDIDVATVLTVSASGSANFAARLAAVDHTGSAATAACRSARPATAAGLHQATTTARST